eukprot:2514572-Prymnesium_polylepis.1
MHDARTRTHASQATRHTPHVTRHTPHAQARVEQCTPTPSSRGQCLDKQSAEIAVVDNTTLSDSNMQPVGPSRRLMGVPSRPLFRLMGVTSRRLFRLLGVPSR